MIRKIDRALVFSLLAFSLLAFVSCGGSRKAQGAIKVLNWGTEGEGQVWAELAKEFSAETGIAVDVETAEWSVYWDKINTLYAANTPPEVFAMDAPLFRDWYARDALLSLDSYIAKEPTLLSSLFPATLTAYKTEKGYYGLPRDFQTIVLHYNMDMFDKAGVAYPTEDWTWEDLRVAAKKLTIKDGKGKISQWGFSPDLYDIEPFMSSIVWSYGGEILSPDYKKTLIAENMEPWKLIWGMLHEDMSIPDSETNAQFENDLFKAGKAALNSSGHWTVPEYAELPFRWAVVPMPKGPAGRATSVNSAGFVMAKNSKNPDAGWKWIQFVLSKKGQTRLAELGFAIPARMDVAESDAYLKQAVPIDHKIFLDATTYAHPKPVFEGYDRWSSAFGDALSAIYDPAVKVEDVLKNAVTAADAALSK